MLNAHHSRGTALAIFLMPPSFDLTSGMSTKDKCVTAAQVWGSRARLGCCMDIFVQVVFSNQMYLHEGRRRRSAPLWRRGRMRHLDGREGPMAGSAPYRIR